MRTLRLAVAVGAALAGLVLAPSAMAGMAQSTVASQTPASWTPQIMDGKVEAIAAYRNFMIVGGNFTTVRRPGGTDMARSGLVMFDTTGTHAIQAFNPLAGMTSVEVTEVVVRGDFLWVAGRTGGVALLTRVNLLTGARADIAGVSVTGSFVEDLALAGNRLFLAGRFTKLNGKSVTAFGAINADTGVYDAGAHVKLTNPRNSTGGAGSLDVQSLTVSPDATKLILTGTFRNVTQVGGTAQFREQIAMLDVGTAITVSNWQTDDFTAICSRTYNTYIRDVDFSPDGAYFTVVNTGAYGGGGLNTTGLNSQAGGRGGLCDSQSRWRVNESTTAQQDPVWINYTGGDSLTQVLDTGIAVYSGGHQRWESNPGAGDREGTCPASPLFLPHPGNAIPAQPCHQGPVGGPLACPGSPDGWCLRSGIAALEPNGGDVLPWNPGRTRGKGVFALTATPAGVWVGSDTTTFAGVTRARLAFVPLS
jgi:hypothetical protein